MPNTVKRLLRDIEALPYPDRMSTVVAAARRLAPTGELPGVIAQLRGAGSHERLLAVTMGVAAGDRDSVVAATADAYRPVRTAAVKACLRHGWLNAGDVIALIADAPADLRMLIYRTLRVVDRPATADALIDAVRDRYGDAEAGTLLPGCGGATVRRLVSDLEHVTGLAVLARRHSDVVLDHVAAAFEPADAVLRAELWRRYGDALLGAAVDQRPERVLDLLERYAPATSLPGPLRRYGVLASVAPHRVLALLVAPARISWLSRTSLPPGVLRRLARLDPADVVLVARRLRDRDPAYAGLLRTLPPARRGALHDAVFADVDTDATVWDRSVMQALPRAWREREARRVIGLDRVRVDEEQVLSWTSYLPWAQAVPMLAAATRRAGADDRSTGYRLLLTAARLSRDPAVAADAVARLDRLRNEQDPVRAAALAELSRLARLLRPASVPMLTRLTTDATEARDGSSATLSALGVLAAAVIQHHFADPVLLGWALQTLDRLFGGHRVPPLGHFDRSLRRGQERVVFDRLRPWIEAQVARAEFAGLFAVTNAFGKRAWTLPELQGLLRRVIDPGVVLWAFRAAITEWLADPATRGQRVAEVLRVDPSAVTLPVVWQTLCARRTDLLDRVLIGRPPQGRFLTAGVRWVPGAARHVDRWLPRQQRSFVRLQAQIAKDAGTAVWTRVRAIADAAPVPVFGRELVELYLDAQDVPLAEAALGALPWTDRPDQALSVLLRHADDDRARVALYAAGRAARFVRPSELAGPLAAVALGTGKITSRKEAIRLLGALGPPSAAGTLVQAWRQPGQHRDVRAAIVSAAARGLHRPGSWDILHEAITGSREEASTVLAVGLPVVAVRDRPMVASLVVAACSSPDLVVRRTGWSALVRWVPWAADLDALVVSEVSDLAEEHTWAAVNRVVRALLDRPGRAAPVVAALRSLTALDAADPAPGGPARDRPARRRVGQLTAVLADWAATRAPDADDVPAEEAVRLLAADARFVPEAAAVLTALVRLDRDADFTPVARLVTGRPVLAARLGHRVTEHARRTAGSWHPEGLRTAASALADRGDAEAGLLALGLARAGAEYGWPPPWRELVYRLRAHPAPDVREAAFNVDMAAPR